MNIRPVVITLLSLVLLTIQPSYARHNPGQQGSGSSHRMDWQKQLDLSKDQMNKIKDISDASHDDMKEMRAKKWKLYKQMVMMSHNKKIDEQKLNSLISNMNLISEKMLRQEIKMKHDIYMALTPKQQAKMDEMLKNRLKHMEKIYGQ